MLKDRDYLYLLFLLKYLFIYTFIFHFSYSKHGLLNEKCPSNCKFLSRERSKIKL